MMRTKERYSVTLSPDTVEKIDRARGEVPRSRIIETACKNWIRKKEKTE